MLPVASALKNVLIYLGSALTLLILQLLRSKLFSSCFKNHDYGLLYRSPFELNATWVGRANKVGKEGVSNPSPLITNARYFQNGLGFTRETLVLSENFFDLRATCHPEKLDLRYISNLFFTFII